MITMDESYGWLNVGDGSHLSGSNALSMLQLEDRKIPLPHRNAIIRSLRSVADLSKNVQETVEIKLALAKVSFAADDLTAAKFDLVDVIDRHKPSPHRLGVAKWMMGILLWRLKDNDAAYANWVKSLDGFIALASEKVRSHDIQMVNWYHDKASLMRLDMVFRAEEANHWLNLHEKSHLSEAGKFLVDNIRKKIQVKEFPLAYEIGLMLARTSHSRLDTLESAEAWVSIGLSAIQMGNPRQAVDYLQRGAAAYNPWGHQQAVARWMMGIAQFMIPEEEDQAIRNWMKAIDAFEGLRVKADRDNNQEQKNWYQSTIATMRKALELKLNRKV